MLSPIVDDPNGFKLAIFTSALLRAGAFYKLDRLLHRAIGLIWVLSLLGF